MARITTLAGMKSYISKNLGAPVIVVEIADTQYDMIIEDCIQLFQKYHTGEGNYLDHLGFTVSAGVSAYSTSGMNLASTIDFTLSTGTDGINTLFSPTHQLLYQDWVIFGNYPGGSGNSSSQHSGMNLAGYEIAMQSLNDIHDMFSIMYHAQYSDARQEILITPTPATAGTGLLTVYRKETAENLYNDDMVKRLCVAKAMIQWGRNLGKYEMTMPSGGTIKGSEILSDGKELLEKIMEDIRMESEPLPFWMA